VDTETWGCLDFPGGRHLHLSCGFSRASDTFTRLLGTAGQINVTNPFHPTAADSFVVFADGREPVTHQASGASQRSFTPLIRHIQAVLRGEEPPRLMAVDTALGSARALNDLAAASQA
jgi:DNA-binding transcriptional regulator of glucitol operon